MAPQTGRGELNSVIRGTTACVPIRVGRPLWLPHPNSTSLVGLLRSRTRWPRSKLRFVEVSRLQVHADREIGVQQQTAGV